MQKRPVVPSVRLRLLAQMESTQIKMGTPVVIKLGLTNVSSRPVHIGHSDVGVDYEFTVTDRSGKELPRTELGNHLLRGEFSLFRSESIDLDPYAETQESLDVAKIYQLTSPGTYYVRAAHSNIFPEKSAGGGPDATNRANQQLKKPFPTRYSLQSSLKKHRRIRCRLTRRMKLFTVLLYVASLTARPEPNSLKCLLSRWAKGTLSSVISS